MKHHDLVEVDAARQIVNTNFGITNIADMSEMDDQIITTLETIEKILKSHCGPTAQLAMLLDANSIGAAFKPSLFTRDGIRILSEIDFMSPLERYIKEMITYIGTRVDIAAHDGTTSSMLTATIFMKKFMQYRKQAGISSLSHYEISQVIDATFADVLSNLESLYGYNYASLVGCTNKDLLSEEEAMASAGKIAFIQGLSSSGGNMEIATSVKKIFENSPRMSWDFIEAYTSKKENGKPYTVEINEFDMRLQTTAATKNALNTAMGTQYHSENTRVIVLIDSMTDDGIITDQLLRYLEEYPEDKNVVVISQSYSGRFAVMVNSFNGTRSQEHQIVLWQYSPDTRLAGSPYPVELLVLAAASGMEPCGHGYSEDFTEASSFIAKEVKWQDGHLFFNGIEGLSDNHTGCLHPYFADLKNAPKFYQEAVEFLTHEIEEHRSGHRPDGQMYGMFMTMLNRIACLRRPILRLGGPVHEQTANLEIQKDVQGAIMASLSTGFTIDGPRCLLGAIRNTSKDIPYVNPYHDENLDRDFAEVQAFRANILDLLDESISEVLDTLYPGAHVIESTSKDTYINAFTYNKNPKTYNLKDYLGLLDRNFDAMNPLQASQLYAKNYPVMQPIAIVKELFKRIHELILKFNNTNKIVISGGVIVGDKKE